MLPALVIDAPISSIECKNILDRASELMRKEMNREQEKKKLNVVETIEAYLLSVVLTAGGMLLPLAFFFTYPIYCRTWFRNPDVQENKIRTKTISKFESK